MKLVSYESGKQTRVGVVEGQNVIDLRTAVAMAQERKGPRSLYGSPAVRDAVQVLTESGLPPRDMMGTLARGDAWLRAAGLMMHRFAEAASTAKTSVLSSLLAPLSQVRLRAPIARPGKIVCVGLNYADHAREGGREPPTAPVFFLKSANTIVGPEDPVLLPPNSNQVDYEAEMAAVIGKPGRAIAESEAEQHIAGYMMLNDVSARDMQFGDKQWFRGKSCDTFAPTGPWIVTRDEVADPHHLHIALTLNGFTMQESNTSNLIFRVPFLVSYLSQSLSWETGDLISTGTPPGVGVFRSPQVFLKHGDTMSVTVEGLGTLTNPVQNRG